MAIDEAVRLHERNRRQGAGLNVVIEIGDIFQIVLRASWDSS